MVERGSEPYSPGAAESALRWWAEAGVDVLIDEEPRDWLRPRLRPAPTQAPRPAAAPALPDRLDAFHDHLASAPTLPFVSPSAPRILPSGDPASGLMILTDMPTGEDLAAGALFSGEVGRLFDRMMAAIGRDRRSLYLAALSCLRSPDGRLSGEAATECATLARHHIGLAAPRALLLFGDGCAKALLGLPVARARGTWHEIATAHGTVRTLVTMPPSYLLGQPSAKPLAWADLQMLMKELNR